MVCSCFHLSLCSSNYLSLDDDSRPLKQDMKGIRGVFMFSSVPVFIELSQSG